MCLSPRSSRYFNAFSGESLVREIPCGNCASCLHRLQDSICIRCEETAKWSDYMVYDTLTFRNDSIQWIDATDLLYNSSKVSDSSIKILEKYYPDLKIPIFEKKVFSAWLKRGRELYNYYHRKAIKEGRMSRLHIKYLICEEYGPKSSRPHAHLVMFGIKPQDYLKFFAKPWRNTYGFTKTKYISKFTKSREKDLQCISRYISKYISKGDFESPLVKDGLQPSPWRQLSHGFGEEYLSHTDKFDFCKTDSALSMKEVSAYQYTPFYNMVTRLWEPKKVSFKGEENYSNLLFSGCDIPHDIKLTDSDITHLTTYYDSLYCPHPLPRYYFDKLCGRDSNLLKYALQTTILRAAGQRCYKKILEFAAASGVTVPSEYRTETEVLEFLRGHHYLLYVRWFDVKRNSKVCQNNGHKIRLKNHYTRSFNDPFNTL